MDWAVLEIKDGSFIPPSQSQPYFVLPPPPTLSSQSNSASNFTTEVSPAVFLAIIVLSVMFFTLGALHLFVRMLLRPPARAGLGPGPDEAEDLTALQGQLQQLFHLHDAGVDQSFIDTLPVFNFKAIIGVKDPFDCAVCLCEFVDEDELRLLPECSHAFHLECIDTWLLSHSTCPLCRASLVGDHDKRCSPIVLVLESRSGSSREIGFGPEMGLGRIDPSDEDLDRKCCEIEAKGDGGVKGKVVPIKLGKFKSLDGVEGSADYTTNNNDDNDEDGNTCGARRCFSMGSFAYVMDENSSLQVPIRTTPMKRQFTKKPSLPLEPGHRPARSVCDCESGREFNGFEAFKIVENENKCIGGNTKESFSVSKIWLRGKKGNGSASAATIGPSRRAFSFRFPGAGDDSIAKNGGVLPEIGLENPGSEMGSCRSCLDDQENTSSFARRTLFWILGKPNKVVHSSFASNV